MTATIFGRASELAAVEQFLDEVLVQASILTIEGDVGAGKTELWSAATAGGRTRGYRILKCNPVESEQSLAFAALGDLFDGVIDDAELRLPEPQDRALRVAMLMAAPGDDPPDQRTVSVATLGALRSLSERAPLLLALDDLQWMDRATARVLEFALRRLESERVGVVAALRPSDFEAVPLFRARHLSTRIRRLTLAPLDADALDSLFRERLGQSVVRPTLAQIATASGGNPLYALELAGAVLRGEIAPTAGQPLSVPGTLQEVVHQRVTDLPPEVRDLLFAAAAVSEPNIELLERFVGHRASVVSAVDDAVGAGIVQVAGGRVSFKHPLFASTLYHAVPAARRQVLHQKLAEVVTDRAERARHLALGATGPDSSVAAVLDDAAHAVAARGAPDSAADLHEQAYRLTPTTDATARLQRRLAAAECHFAAGDLDRARQILEETAVGLERGPVRASVLRSLAKVRYRRDSSSVAAELLTRALTEAADDVSLRAAIERDLAWAVMHCGDMREAAEHAASALALIEGRGTNEMLAEVLAANAMATFLLGQGLSDETMRRATALETMPVETPIEWRPSTMLGMMAKWSGETSDACQRFVALHGRSVETGEETSLPFLLAQMSETASWEGNWTIALEYAERANTLALQTGQEPIRATALYAKALAEVHLGRLEGARSSAAAGLEHAKRSGSVVDMMSNQSVLGSVELSADDPAKAHAYLGPLVAWLDVVGIREPGVAWFIPDEVEALVGVGEVDKAKALLAAYEADATRLQRTWAMLASARCRALLTAASGDARRAATDLDDALEKLGAGVPLFERARAMYVLGTVLRRTRQRRAARASLEAALELFQSLGAEVWSAKAMRMLGGGANAASGGEGPQLTPAERRVARAVASGASNREVANRLFVSVRAVELHLTNIYRKLGIKSRTQLAVRMAGTRSSARGSDRSRRSPSTSQVATD